MTADVDAVMGPIICRAADFKPSTMHTAFLLTGLVDMKNVMVNQDLALNTVAACILGGVNFGSGRAWLIGPAVASFFLTFGGVRRRN